MSLGWQWVARAWELGGLSVESSGPASAALSGAAVLDEAERPEWLFER
jgi:hypothetical protein